MPLSLAPDLVLRVPHVGRVYVQNPRTRRHLILTPPQWAVLQSFVDGRTVPAVLKHLIHERACIPLHDFYELVLQARAAGILRGPRDSAPPFVSAPAEWWRSLEGRFARPLVAAFFGLVLVLLLLRSAVAPAHPAWWALGWALTCVAISAGHFLAACAVHEADLEVHGPRFVWRRAFPGFGVDLSDAVLGGPRLLVDCALFRLLPQLVLLAPCAAWVPDLVLPLACGLLVLVSPFWPSPGLDLLRALRRTPRLSVEDEFRFPPNRTLLRRLRSRLGSAELRFALLRTGVAVVWLGFGLCVWTLLRPDDTAELIAWARRVDLALLTPVLLLGLVVLAVGVVLTLVALAFAEHFLGRIASWRRRRATERALLSRPAPNPAGVLAFLGETFPFTLLPAEPRRGLADSARVIEHAAGETVVGDGDARPLLRLLYSGRLSAHLADEDGRPGKVISLHPGVVFAEGGLLHGTPQPGEVRATLPSVVLEVDATAYERHVAPHIPRDKLEDAAQKIAFLRDIPLCRDWPGPVLAALARRAQVHHFGTGAVLLADGRENTFFHLLADGELRVMKGGRRLARLFRGDFFGELSLLCNTVAQADIVAHRPGRCLTVPKQDFLLFLAQDADIALQFERIASRRLGRPVFSV